jgi:hypothetical protein
MTGALGEGYAESWARDQHLSQLEGLTPAQALDSGVPPRTVWAAVWESLGLPARDR